MAPSKADRGDTPQEPKPREAKQKNRQELIARCQAEFSAICPVEDAGICLVPPDIGSQLYDWYLEHDGGSASTEESSGEEVTFPVPFDQMDSALSSPAPREAIHGGSHRILKRPPELTMTSLESPKRQRTSPPTSSLLSETDAVFTPTQQRYKSATSEAESSLSYGLATHRREVLRGQRSIFGMRRTSPAGGRALAVPSSSRDEVYDDLDDMRKTRPASFPKTWESAHPADKMVVILRHEDQDWTTLAYRWNQLTGHNDTLGHLQWRYEHLKISLGLSTDQDIEDILLSEAISRSKAFQTTGRTHRGTRTSFSLSPEQSPGSNSDGVVQTAFEASAPATKTIHGPKRSALRRRSSIRDIVWSKEASQVSQEAYVTSRRLPKRVTMALPSYEETLRGELPASAEMCRWICLKLPSKKFPLAKEITVPTSREVDVSHLDATMLNSSRFPRQHVDLVDNAKVFDASEIRFIDRNATTEPDRYGMEHDFEIWSDTPVTNKKIITTLEPSKGGGKPISQETRHKMSIKQRAAWQRRRAEGRESRDGKYATTKTDRYGIEDDFENRIDTPTTNKKIIMPPESSKGSPKPISQETRHKISIKQRAAWQRRRAEDRESRDRKSDKLSTMDATQRDPQAVTIP